MLGELLKPVVSSIIGPLIERIPDPNERARLQAQSESNLLSALTGLVQGQLKINEEEAKHKSIFVAGWRPAVGWMCVLGIGWAFVVKPLVVWVAFLFGTDLQGAPTLDTGELMTLLLGMLGLGGLRTYEKRLGVARAR